MSLCGIEAVPQWLLPCLLAVAVVAGSRLLRRPAVRQVLLISSPALVAVALAVFLILTSFSRQSWSDVLSLHIGSPAPSPNLMTSAGDRRSEVCRGPVIWTSGSREG